MLRIAAMKLVTVAWVLSLLTKTEPSAPWKESYESTAKLMADSANASPLLAGENGALQTAALYVSVSWFEARHDPKAEGDRDCTKRDLKGRCAGAPHSFCFGQINDSNFGWLATRPGFWERVSGEARTVTRSLLIEDPKTCMTAMHTMLQTSFRICASLPVEQRLSWYAAGGPACVNSEDARKKSEHRVRKAQWLFAHYPPE